MLAPPLPHTENSVFRRFCHKPPSPRRWTLFVGKRQYKKTVKLIIFHPRAGRPGGIRASDLEAPCQNCLVVQRAAKRPFAPPSSPAGSRIWAPLCQHPPSSLRSQGETTPSLSAGFRNKEKRTKRTDGTATTNRRERRERTEQTEESEDTD